MGFTIKSNIEFLVSETRKKTLSNEPASFMSHVLCSLASQLFGLLVIFHFKAFLYICLQPLLLYLMVQRILFYVLTRFYTPL